MFNVNVITDDKELIVNCCYAIGFIEKGVINWASNRVYKYVNNGNWETLEGNPVVIYGELAYILIQK